SPSQEGVHPANAARHTRSRKRALVIASNEARKHLQSSGGDDEIVIAATKALGSVLHDLEAPPVPSVLGSEFLETDHAVSDAMLRLVGRLGRKVVKQENGWPVTGEVVLQCQDLAAIPQGALR